jgi:hypothetical protein
MAEQESIGFLNLDKTEDQLVLAALACVIVSFYFGLQPGFTSTILWAGIGCGALVCIYFAFPNMWPYSILLYASYGISAFGVILLFLWYDAIRLFGISVPIPLGIFFIASGFYMAYHIVESIKKTRDRVAEEQQYVPLGFWSIAVMLFFVFSVLSIISWVIWANSGGAVIQLYMVLEIIIAFLLIYILWLPDRSMDWSVENLPESPATRFITRKSKVLAQKVSIARNICPECGLKLRIEKKVCPSCGGSQNLGWCVRSEAYVIPCAKCQSMALHGKEKCDECGEILSNNISCTNCGEGHPIKDWAAKT